ncbi:MAG: TPM domain-containing protein [Deltaproteobacteria bacterium]|nr:TPM domain-containing protein [Deltaproteobacteria bacterium]
MRPSKFHILPLCLLIFGFCLSNSSWSLSSPTGYVNDLANILKPETVHRVDEMAGQLKLETSIELAIVTVPSLDGNSIDDYAARLFENWKIGKKGADNGLLFLVAPVERKARIEVGYGLEGELNDAKAARLLRDYFVPNARAGDMDKGVEETVGAITQLFSAEGKAATPKKPSRRFSIFDLLILVAILYFAIRHPFLFLMFLGSGHSRSSGGFGGGGGGGFGGFGGGSSGGGGGSSSW